MLVRAACGQGSRGEVRDERQDGQDAGGGQGIQVPLGQRADRVAGDRCVMRRWIDVTVVTSRNLEGVVLMFSGPCLGPSRCPAQQH